MWMQMGQEETFSFEYPGPQDPFHSEDIISISVRDWLFIGGPPMATKVKGLFKGFKNITQIFVVKEHEMEIGYPTDVKHVAHIGWDSASMNAPSWMNELRPSNDYSSTSLGNHGESREASWISQGFDRPGGLQPSLATNIDCIQPDKPKAPKRTKRKKSKVSSPSSSSRSSRRSSRAAQCTTIDEEGRDTHQVCTIK